MTMTVTPAVLALPHAVGTYILHAFAAVGRVSRMLAEFVRGLAEWRIWLPRTIEESWNVGIGSLFIILLVSGFAGAVTALQAGYQFTGSIPIYIVGSLVVESIVLELGPVLTALVLAGRIGARYAAELGTMRVTEQIDALESLGRSPASHLLVPRILACMLMIPVLTVLADVIGVASGWYFSLQVLPITNSDFTYGARAFWRDFDAYYSVIKGFAFGLSIAVISTYMGFSTKQGAEGVGKATTTAVVVSSVLILLLDTLLARMLLHG